MKPDPRLYQIATLACLLGYGLIRLDFEIPLVQAASMLGTALVTQFACTRLWRLPAFDPRSALISGLSLCLLLRTNSLALAIAAAIVTVGSKFVIRINGKHLFNPTNFGVVAMMLLTGPGVGLAGAVGQRRVLRVPDGVPRRAGRQPRGAERRHVRVHRLLHARSSSGARSGSASRWRFRCIGCRAARCCSSPSS